MKSIVIGLALLMCVMSLALFAAMGKDKRLARVGAYRVPEKRLFGMALLFGAPGGLLGMYFFRHKTKHWYFVVGFWALAVLQLALLSYLAYRYM